MIQFSHIKMDWDDSSSLQNEPVNRIEVAMATTRQTIKRTTNGRTFSVEEVLIKFCVMEARWNEHKQLRTRLSIVSIPQHDANALARRSLRWHRRIEDDSVVHERLRFKEWQLLQTHRSWDSVLVGQQAEAKSLQGNASDPRAVDSRHSVVSPELVHRRVASENAEWVKSFDHSPHNRNCLSIQFPVIAVSVGPSILFYRNMKPYFKYTVPSLMIEAYEKDIWSKMPSDRTINFQKYINELKSMNISHLSSLSQRLIALPEEEVEAFLKENMDPKLERLPTIVAMTTIYKSIEEEKSPNCLVIATEAGDILIMDAQSFNILHTARVCNFKTTPDLISASGSYQSDFKVVIATREGSICILRKNWLEGREIVKLQTPATAMCLLQIDQTIVVLSNSLMCYSKKGKMLWSMTMQDTVMCMTPVSLPHLGVSLVSLKSEKLNFWRLISTSKSFISNNLSKIWKLSQFLPPTFPRFALHSKADSCRFTLRRASWINFSLQVRFLRNFPTENEATWSYLINQDTVMAMTFGKLGQEEHVLVLVTNSKSRCFHPSSN